MPRLFRVRYLPFMVCPRKNSASGFDWMGGIPEELIDDEELLELLSPSLRADFSVCETYEYTQGIIPCPIVALGDKTTNFCPNNRWHLGAAWPIPIFQASCSREGTFSCTLIRSSYCRQFEKKSNASIPDLFYSSKSWMEEHGEFAEFFSRLSFFSLV